MAAESFQYQALFEYKRERGDDINLQPGDLLTVPRASVATGDYQEGDERIPKGWLHGTNERTKETGDFPGTFVEYVGVVRAGPSASKSWPRPVPPTPGGVQAAGGPLPPGATALGGKEGVEVLSELAPVVVQRLIEAMEKHGLETEPFYRNPLASPGPPELRQALDTDPASVDLEPYEVAVLSDTLRAYLQDLPSPMVPAGVHSELLYTAQETQSMEECGDRLRRILESPSVPQPNHQLLVHLTKHLSRLAHAGTPNQASPRLLGQAFSEVIFKNSLFSADVNPEHHVKIMEALITAGGLLEMQAAPGREGSL